MAQRFKLNPQNAGVQKAMATGTEVSVGKRLVKPGDVIEGDYEALAQMHPSGIPSLLIRISGAPVSKSPKRENPGTMSGQNRGPAAAASQPQPVTDEAGQEYFEERLPIGEAVNPRADQVGAAPGPYVRPSREEFVAAGYDGSTYEAFFEKYEADMLAREEERERVERNALSQMAPGVDDGAVPVPADPPPGPGANPPEEPPAFDPAERKTDPGGKKQEHQMTPVVPQATPLDTMKSVEVTEPELETAATDPAPDQQTTPEASTEPLPEPETSKDEAKAAEPPLEHVIDNTKEADAGGDGGKLSTSKSKSSHRGSGRRGG